MDGLIDLKFIAKLSFNFNYFRKILQTLTSLFRHRRNSSKFCNRHIILVTHYNTRVLDDIKINESWEFLAIIVNSLDNLLKIDPPLSHLPAKIFCRLLWLSIEFATAFADTRIRDMKGLIAIEGNYHNWLFLPLVKTVISEL